MSRGPYIRLGKSFETPTRPQWFKLVDDYLMGGQVKSAGSYAPVSGQDFDRLDEIVRGLILLKYEPDPDGDVPIDYILANRHKEWLPGFDAYPHMGKGKNLRNRLLQVCQSNLGIAFRQMEFAIRSIMETD